MKAGHRRLTAGELALARQAFAASISYDRILLIEGAAGSPIAAAAFRSGNSAITLRRSIHFQRVYHQADFSIAKPAAQGLLIHELTHVWQFTRLGVLRFLARYGADYAGCGFNAGRMYDYQAGATRFPAARLEAQAQIAGDYMTACIEGDEPRRQKLGLSLAGSGLYGL